jgi:hypothetical protein
LLTLKTIKRTDKNIIKNMSVHYSKPKGFVGRNICYAIYFNDILYGHIVGGSSTMHLVGRDKFFNITTDKHTILRSIVNNIFYHVEPITKYPIRNFTTKILALFRKKIEIDWYLKYNDKVIGFESLIELPRTGETYKRDSWIEVGITHGYTCKRTGGVGTDSYTGKRVWDVVNLRPKRVFCRFV